MAPIFPALRFEAEAFRLGNGDIMGRHSAGEGFMRAILALPELKELYGNGPKRSARQAFDRIVKEHRPDVVTRWIPTGSDQPLRQIGKIHFPDPTIAEPARQRLSAGVASWSITGITHTISSLGAMRAITDLVLAPVMEWDGLILTSEAVKQSVDALLYEQLQYTTWRMPGAKKPTLPRMPVIPLGVHCSDFKFSTKDRVKARLALGLGLDDVAFLFLGRLSFHAKANPFAQYIALEETAKRTGKSLTMIHCGWFAMDHIEKAFKEASQRYAPSVKHIWLDGRAKEQRMRCWAASDVFLALSDNIQETFGLTPLEAMSSGLPVIASDWNGYKDTVRHGVSGLRTPTYAPEPPAGQNYAAVHAIELISYDTYLSLTSKHISVDIAALIENMEALAIDPKRRRTMGEAGRRIALSEFDWGIIMARYLEFWSELDAIRTSAAQKEHSTAMLTYPDRIDPYRIFAHYPTHHIGMATVLRKTPFNLNWYELLEDPLFKHGKQSLPPPAYFAALFDAYQIGFQISLSDACQSIRMSRKAGILTATVLIKMGILEVVL